LLSICGDHRKIDGNISFMIRRNNRIFTLLCITTTMLACAPVLAPASVAPTFDPNSISTYIIQTANAAATQTALVAPPTSTFTNVPLPTHTPFDTPSPTATFIFILPTPTVPSSTPAIGSSNLKFDCQVLSQSPQSGTHMSPNNSFTMAWQVRNIGKGFWDSNSTDYRYKSGSKLHKTSAYDFPSSIVSGGQVEIKVAMTSPGSSGSYTTTWDIKTGKTEFCNMSLTIQVP